MPKKAFSISRKHLAILCLVGLCVSLLPLYAISFYNHPFYDDFGFSIRTHTAWRETGSIAQVVAAAFQNTVGIRQTWQGMYTPSFISAMQPGLFGESLYWIATFVLLSTFLHSLWFFLRTALRPLGADSSVISIAFACLSFVMVQLIPDVTEGFFWFNGGVGYTLMWSIMLFSISVWILFDRATGRGKSAAYYVLLLVLMVLSGGGAYSTLLLFSLLSLCFVAWAFFKRKPKRWLHLLAAVLLLACFAFSMAAPGNAVRAKTLQGGMSAPMALLESFYFGLALMGSWFSLPLVAVCVLLGYLLLPALRQCKCRFAYPLLLTLASTCLFCAQLTPTLFTGNYLGDGRTLNTYYYTYVLMIFGNVLYWLGWGLRKSAAKEPAESLAPEAPGKGVPLRVLSVALALLVAGCLSFRPEGAEDWWPPNMAGGSAAYSLLRGEAQEYHRQMSARDAELNDPTKPEVVLTPITAIPKVFMSDALSSSSLEYVLSLYAEYYGKTAVTVSPAKE